MTGRISNMEIKAILDKFQAGYTKRDLENLDAFMDELFVKSSETFIVGTSDNEIFLGFDQVRGLIEGDWKYWGDVVFDTENVITTTFDEVVWFTTQGTVQYTFDSSEETCERFVELAKGDFADEQLTPHEKLTAVNWTLAHLLHDWEMVERTYLWPLTLSGVLVKIDDDWKFKTLQFCVPVNERQFPDVRYRSLDEYNNSRLFQHVKENMSKYPCCANRPRFEQLLVELQDQVNDLTDSGDAFINTLATNEQCYFINPKNEVVAGADQILAALSTFREQIDQIQLDIDQAIIWTENDQAWFATIGLATKVWNPETLYADRLAELKEVLTEEIPSKEKLFNLRRDIAGALKAAASGETMVWPIRVKGFLSKEEDQWKILNLHISYPFDYILEGKLGVLTK